MPNATCLQVTGGLIMRNKSPKLFLIVGNPASGKDELIEAVHVIGSLHAEIVPKHTDRSWRIGDDDEMICYDLPDFDNPEKRIENPNYDLENCDISYINYGTTYGIKTSLIWDKLRQGITQVLVVSNKDALNALKATFDDLAIVVYVYAQISSSRYREIEEKKQLDKKRKDPNYTIDYEYINQRVNDFDQAWKLYEDNFMLFNHVFIYADKKEDLFDQIFRLFRAYERGF